MHQRFFAKIKIDIEFCGMSILIERTQLRHTKKYQDYKKYREFRITYV